VYTHNTECNVEAIQQNYVITYTLLGTRQDKYL